MKSQLKNITKLLLVLLFVSLSNCQKDEIPNNLEEETVQKTPTIRTLSLDNVGEVFNRLKRNLKIDPYLQLEHQTNTLAKTSQDTLGITIYTDVIKEVTLGNYTSYTMRVASPNTDDSKFYNLTIEDKNGESDIFVTKYTPTQNWLNDTNAVFEGNVSTIRTNDFTDVFDDNFSDESNDSNGDGSNDYNPFGTYTGTSDTYPTDCNGMVFSTTVLAAYTCGCGHWPGNPACIGSECGAPTYAGYHYITTYECVADTEPIDNVNTSDAIDFNNPNSGGSVSTPDDSSISGMVGPNDDECDELPPGDLNGDCQISFYEGCLLNGNSPEVCSCADQGEDLNVCIVTDCLDTSYLPGFLQLSIIDQGRVANYLNNNCNNQSEQFAIAAIDALLDEEEVDFDNEWIFEINETIEFQNQTCLKSIKDDVINNNQISKIIKKFEPEHPILHLEWGIFQNDNWRNTGHTLVNQSISTAFININSESLNHVDNIVMVKTIAHEIIHAELYRKLKELVDQLNILTQPEYEALIDNFPGIADYTFRYGTLVYDQNAFGQIVEWSLTPNYSLAHHNQMANHYRGVLIDVMMEYDLKKGITRDNPTEFYEALSWAGLRSYSEDGIINYYDAWEDFKNQVDLEEANLPISERKYNRYINISNQEYDNSSVNCN